MYSASNAGCPNSPQFVSPTTSYPVSFSKTSTYLIISVDVSSLLTITTYNFKISLQFNDGIEAIILSNNVNI